MYSFGLILLEIVTRKRSFSSLSEGPLHAGLDYVSKSFQPCVCSGNWYKSSIIFIGTETAISSKQKSLYLPLLRV